MRAIAETEPRPAASLTGTATKPARNGAKPPVDVARSPLIIDAMEPADVDLAMERFFAATGVYEPHLDGWTAATDTSDTAYTDELRQYLNEIGKIPLLTAAEEIVLAQRIERARQAQSQLEAEGLPSQQRAVLTKSVEDGERARKHFATANLRLVVSVAKKHLGRGMELMDLIQEGNTGLMKAVERYDYHKGYRFSTYATWWIRQKITRAIADQARTIRLPVHVSDYMGRIARVVRRLQQELGADPSQAQIAVALGTSEEKVEELIGYATQHTMSFETMVGPDHDVDLGDFLEERGVDGEVITAETAAEKILLIEDVAKALNNARLTDREKLIINMRFGLAGGTAHTLEKVGGMLGVTRERIRQIEEKALREIRRSGKARKLLRPHYNS